MDFETWINQCTDPTRFATEFVEIRSDILFTIKTGQSGTILSLI